MDGAGRWQQMRHVTLPGMQPVITVLLVLSGMVVSGRRRHMVSFGDGGNADLMAASRAFGNCVEYATPGMAAMALLALVLLTPSILWVWADAVLAMMGNDLP